MPGAPGLVIGLIFLVPCAIAGLALVGAGLGRSRSAAHAMMSALCVLAVSALAYFFCGYAWQGAIGPAHIAHIGGKEWNWLGANRFFLHSSTLDLPGASLALLGMFSVAIAALIPLSAGADRWRLGACCLSSAVFAGWTFPLFAHWVWGGWLMQLGRNYSMGDGFLDAGGSGTIQAVGGLTALSMAWLLGPRHGKYTRDGLPTAIPGHNAVLVMLGCMLSLIGWIALNGAGAAFYYGTPRIPIIAINTILSACSAALAAAAVTRLRFGKPDLSLTANGFVGGLAASSAACAWVIPAEAVVIGAVAGVLVTLCVEWIELYMGVDDPGGAISAHAMGGIWGVLALGIFVTNAPGGPSDSLHGDHGQWLAQVVGVATLIGFVLPLTYGLNWLIDRVYRQRVDGEGERQGMDLYELGAGAYPEFIVHSDEFIER